MKEQVSTFIKEHKKWVTYTTILIVAVTAAITYSIAFNVAMRNFNYKIAEINERQAMYQKLSEVDQAIRQDYIGTIDENKLIESLCTGYSSGLPDSYSLYMSDELFKMYSAAESGKAFNIGISTLTTSKNQVEVVNVQAGSPAEVAGIKTGDIILSINNKDVDNMKYAEVTTRLTGAPGSSIELLLYRGNGGTGETLKVVANCSSIEKQVLDFSLLDGKVGYISIYSFENTLQSQFEKAIGTLKDQGAQSYVIDLRNNFSGEVQYSAKLLDYLLPEGDTIYTIDKKSNKTVAYTSSAISFNANLVVMINSNTCGAGEIFASAMKDNKAATVLGENTRGRTTRNEIVSLSDGSAVLIPVAHYVTKDSGIITGVGLAPNTTIGMSTADKDLLSKRHLDKNNDSQLQASLKHLLGEAYKDPNAPKEEVKEEVQSEEQPQEGSEG